MDASFKKQNPFVNMKTNIIGDNRQYFKNYNHNNTHNLLNILNNNSNNNNTNYNLKSQNIALNLNFGGYNGSGSSTSNHKRINNSNTKNNCDKKAAMKMMIGSQGISC